MSRVRLLVTAVLMTSTLVAAQAPARLGYQGRLLKSDGTPVTGLTTVTFTLFDAATAGTALWSEAQQLGLSDGYYDTFLGDIADGGVGASLFDGTERYLELSLGGVALKPRQRVASVAYALRAEEAKNLAGGSVQANTVTVNGAPVVALSVAGCTTGQVLTWSGSTWTCVTAGVAGAAGGDLSGTYPNPAVARLNGVAVSVTAPTSGQVLTYAGSQWQGAALPVATGSSLGVAQAGAGLTATAGTLAVAIGTTSGTVAAGDDARLAAVVPSGAVMAFNLASCPTGWTPLAGAAGRFIIGVGTLSSDSYALNGTGGEARHTLTVSEMPSHSHNIGGVYGKADLSGAVNNQNMSGAGTGTFYGAASQGGDQAHENRPPYLALLYCQKS